jgi:hypothetical protein
MVISAACRAVFVSLQRTPTLQPFHSRPSRLERISELERKLNFTMRPGASLVQIVQAHRRNHADEARQQSFCFR